MNIELNLAIANGDTLQYIDVNGFDSASIDFHMVEGSTFDSAIVSIRKTNTINGTPTDFTPALTVSAATLVELDARDWAKTNYLVLVVTTASSGAARATATVALKKNDASSFIDPITIEPATSGGASTFHLVSAATANATVVKAAAGQVYGWFIYNSMPLPSKVAFHNSATTPTAGSSIYFALVIPATSGANVWSDHGIPFSAGIGITTVTGMADSDTTAVGANDLVINLWYL